MPKIFVYLLAVTLTLLLLFIGLDQLSVPKIQTSEHGFSVANALAHLKAIANEPHPAGTEANARVRDYIVSTIRSFGMESEIQEATVSVKTGGSRKPVDIRNILVRLGGTSDTKPLLVNCHYDSVGTSFGAGDNGISVAVLLEVLRVMKQSPAPKNSVIFLFNDGEEYYLKGAQAFESAYPAGGFSAVVNFEGMNGGPSMIVDTSIGSGWIVSLYLKSAFNPVAYSAIDGMGEIMGMGFDLAVFEHEASGIGLAPSSNMLTYHLPYDNYEYITPSTVYHHGVNALILVQALGNHKPDKDDATNQIFFNLFRGIVITYSFRFAIFSSLAVMLLSVFLLSFALGKKYCTLVGLLRGSVFSLLVVLACSVIGGITGLVFSAFRDGYFGAPIQKGIRMPFVYESANSILAMSVALMVALSFILLKALLKKSGKTELQCGALLVWTALLMLTLISNVKLTYVFSWPVLFGCLSMIVGNERWFSGKSDVSRRLVSFFLAAAPVMLIFAAPVAVLLGAFIRFNLLSLLGLVVGISSILVIPQLFEGNKLDTQH